MSSRPGAGRLLLDKVVTAEAEQEFRLAAHYLCAQYVAALLELYRVTVWFDVGATAGGYGRRLRHFENEATNMIESGQAVIHR